MPGLGRNTCVIWCLVCKKMLRGYTKQVDDLNYLGSGSTFDASLQLILFFLFILIEGVAQLKVLE